MPRLRLSPAEAAAAALLLFVVLFWRLGDASFWDPDEAHYAETTSELLETGDWWAPFYNEEPFFDKPIFFHQLQAVAMLVAGETELGARLVPALAALALVLFTWWFGTRVAGADTGLVAGLLLAVNPGSFGLARYAILDTLFTAFLFAGAGLVVVAALHGRPWLQWPGYVLIACAAMVKGPLAFALAGLAMGLSLAVSADLRRRLLALRWVSGLVLAVAISAPWFVYMYFRFGDAFISGYLLDENIRLFATDRFPGQPGPFFYIQILATGMLPWTGLIVGRLIDDVRAFSRRRIDPVEVLLWAWTIAVVAFFSFSRFKLDHYVFTAAPTLCLLCARAWADLRADPAADAHRGARIGLWMVGPLLLLLAAAAAYFLVVQFDLPAATMLVPVVIGTCGTLILLRSGALRAAPVAPPRVPWLTLASLATIYVALLVAVIPALERQKVVPEVARWVAGRLAGDTRVCSYQLSRWNTAFRFYVDRHVTMMDHPNQMTAFLNEAGPFYCAMTGAGFDELVARGAPLQEVYAREGMWVTSGRVLWRRPLPPTRFVVVTR